MQSVEPGFDPALLLDPVQVAEPDCRRRYSIDIDDWHHDGHGQLLQTQSEYCGQYDENEQRDAHVIKATKVHA